MRWFLKTKWIITSIRVATAYAAAPAIQNYQNISLSIYTRYIIYNNAVRTGKRYPWLAIIAKITLLFSLFI